MAGNLFKIVQSVVRSAERSLISVLRKRTKTADTTPTRMTRAARVRKASTLGIEEGNAALDNTERD